MSQSNPFAPVPRRTITPARVRKLPNGIAPPPGISVQAVLAVAANLRNNARPGPPARSTQSSPPPVYRPQPAAVAHSGAPRPSVHSVYHPQAAPSLQRSNRPQAPPVYCPQPPREAWRPATTAQRASRHGLPAGLYNGLRPSPPAVYRPQPVPGQAATPARPAARPSPQSPPVQRKVGFELELGIPVSRYIAGEESPKSVRIKLFNQLRADMQSDPFNGAERVRGHEDIEDRRATEGWRATVDNTNRLGSHKANLEIVTVPIETESLVPSQCEAELKRQIENINLWLKQIISEDPQTKRTRVGATKYVIGFPPPALVKDMGQSMNDYVPGQISLEAYVQVNIDAPFEGVKRILQQAAIEENIPSDADKAAGATVQTILSSLDKLRAFELADVPALTGFLTLLARAVMNASVLPWGSLLKKLWSILPKSGLNQWWRNQALVLSPTARAYFVTNLDANSAKIVSLCCNAFKINSGSLLIPDNKWKRNLPRLAQDEPVFQKLVGLTVGGYIQSILKGAADPLVDVALAHKKSTGGGTSRLKVNETWTHSLGVLEVRNLTKFWPHDTWYQRALTWLKLAYEITGKNWDIDSHTEEFVAMTRQEEAYNQAYVEHYAAK